MRPDGPLLRPKNNRILLSEKEISEVPGERKRGDGKVLLQSLTADGGHE